MKKIVLINFTWIGHHLSFVRTFSKILLEQGHKVCCVMPHPEKVHEWIKENSRDKLPFFSYHHYDYQPISPKGWGRFNHTVCVLHRWKHEARLVKKIEKESGENTDFVFYGWVDNQLSQYISPFVLDRIFPWQWGGLYFHPYHLRQTDLFLKRKAVWRDMDAVFLAKKCVAVALHDKAIVPEFSKRIGKPVLHFAETADATAPDPAYPLANRIREKAAGRIVVGMVGCEKHKGTLTLLRAAQQADPKKYFFVFAGMLPESTYSAEEWREVQGFIHSDPENCLLDFDLIPEGAAYNAVFCAFNIIYLVYDNFISSSNRLTKAAIFEKLVLASDNYCVGDDVKNYDLGETVTPQNAEAVLSGLEKLKIRIEEKNYPFEKWKEYRRLNSDEKLVESFKELMGLLN